MVDNIRNIAYELADKYSIKYTKDYTSKKVENLLCILELPLSTRDIEVIKKQYKKLVKKYYQDVYKQSDKKFGEVSDAYNELFMLLGAAY